MRVMKVLGNIFGVLLSLVVSLALFVMLIITPVISGLSAFTQADTIRQMVQDIDFAQIVRDNLAKGNLTEAEYAELETVLHFTETKAFDQLLDLYAQDLTSALDEKPQPSKITPEALRKIINDNMDELVEMVRRVGTQSGENMSGLTNADIEKYIHDNIDQIVADVLKVAPTAQDLRKLIDELSGGAVNGNSVNIPEAENSSRDEAVSSNDIPSNQGGSISGIMSDNGDGNYTVIFGDGTSQTITDGKIVTTDENGNTKVVTVITSGGTSGGTIGTITKNATLHMLSVGEIVLRSPVDGSNPSGGAADVELSKLVVKVAQMAKSGQLVMICVGAIAILALLIFLFRFPRFKGFTWVAVVMLVGAAIVLFLSAFITNIPYMVLPTAQADPAVLKLLEPVLGVMTSNLITAAIAYAVVAVVLIVLVIVLRKAKAKKADAKACVEAPAELEAEVCEVCCDVSQEEDAEPAQEPEEQEVLE